MDALIKAVDAGVELDDRHIDAAVEFLLDEHADDAKKAHFLQALAAKGETAGEIAEFVTALLDRAIDPEADKLKVEGPTIDVCGTGGDKLNLFNVSTTAMFVLAAGGAVVLKHGNRGITSKSGGADVLEALGIPIDLSPEGFRRCVDKARVGFLFAPLYHPAFKAVMPARKKLAAKGKRTIFNLIGPLLNPARPSCQLVGVTDPELPPTYSEILQRLGRESAWAVHGTTSDGSPVDELSTMGPTTICKSGTMEDHEDEEIHPRDFSLSEAEVEDLQGGDAKENAQILVDILSGKDTGPKLDIVLLNAGAGLACAGLEDNLGTGIERARKLIRSGAALKRLHLLQEAAKG